MASERILLKMSALFWLTHFTPYKGIKTLHLWRRMVWFDRCEECNHFLDEVMKPDAQGQVFLSALQFSL